MLFHFMTERLRFQLGYRFSKAWLILWLILFLPVGVAMLCTGVQWNSREGCNTIYYHGSRFWLCFWALLCFPVALILGVVNGFSLVIDRDFSRA